MKGTERGTKSSRLRVKVSAKKMRMATVAAFAMLNRSIVEAYRQTPRYMPNKWNVTLAMAANTAMVVKVVTGSRVRTVSPKRR